MAQDLEAAKTACSQSSSNNKANGLDLDDFPYLKKLSEFQHAYPALKAFLDKVTNNTDQGRQIVARHYARELGRSPGRCAVLEFQPNHVQEVGCFATKETLRDYLSRHPPLDYTKSDRRRLFILEDMDPALVDLLGHHLGVDPLVFSEQMNTWNFTDHRSIPHRALPSMHTPAQSFTLRYYEFRTIDDPNSVNTDKVAMTFASNRRKYERWRDISTSPKEKRHAFIRRCASFWTSQSRQDERDEDDLPTAHGDDQGNYNDTLPGDKGVIRSQDDPRAADEDRLAAKEDRLTAKDESRTVRQETDAAQGDNRTGGTKSHSSYGWDTVLLVDPGMNAAHDLRTGRALILRDKKAYRSRQEVWDSAEWQNDSTVYPEPHDSVPYHEGCPTLAPLLFPNASQEALESMKVFQQQRDMASPLDELVFYWTKVAGKTLIQQARKDAVNSTYFLLKYLAQCWTNQLELICCSVAQSLYFADDVWESINEWTEPHSDASNATVWKKDLKKVIGITKDINYTRRQMDHFERAMMLNLERLGMQLGSETVNEKLPRSVRDAQLDFLTIEAKLTPLHERVDELVGLANELAGLRAAFKSIQDGEFGLRLSLFASIVFPLTLVASILSMGDGYLPGQHDFWIFWAASVPFVIVFAVLLVYGRRPWRLFGDFRNALKEWKGKAARPAKEKTS